MKVGIYAVYDLVAQTIIGGLRLEKHDSPAIRWFVDAASQETTLIHQHPADFQLVRLGWVDDTDTQKTIIIADHAVILDGSTWLASRPGHSDDPPLNDKAVQRLSSVDDTAAQKSFETAQRHRKMTGDR